jgi:hypothetical protein
MSVAARAQWLQPARFVIPYSLSRQKKAKEQ